MHELNPKYIAYYRVSTDKQGIRGLGMESQKDIVESFVKKHNGDIVNSYLEVASGKKINREQLTLALKECKKNKAILIVAKLDRLARDALFVFELQKSKVDFVAADFPQADKLMIRIISVFAEHEADMISQRTKAALKKTKENGKKLGNPELHKINDERIKKSLEFADALKSIIMELREKNLSYKKLAQELNLRGIKTSKGLNKWSPVLIHRVVSKLKTLTC